MALSLRNFWNRRVGDRIVHWPSVISGVTPLPSGSGTGTPALPGGGGGGNFALYAPYTAKQATLTKIDTDPATLPGSIEKRLKRTLTDSERAHYIMQVRSGLAIDWINNHPNDSPSPKVRAAAWEDYDTSLSTYLRLTKEKPGTGSTGKALIHDTFTDTDGTLAQNHSMDRGGGWESVRPGWQILSDKLHFGGAGSVGHIQSVDKFSGPKHTLRCTFRLASQASSFWLYARWVASDDQVFVDVRPNAWGGKGSIVIVGDVPSSSGTGGIQSPEAFSSSPIYGVECSLEVVSDAKSIVATLTTPSETLSTTHTDSRVLKAATKNFRIGLLASRDIAAVDDLWFK